MEQLNFSDFYLETVEIEGPKRGGIRQPMDKHTINIAYRPKKSGCSYVRLSSLLENELTDFSSVQIKRNPITGEVFLFFSKDDCGTHFRIDKMRSDRPNHYPIINSAGFTKALLKVCGVEIKDEMPIVRMQITDNLAPDPRFFTVKIVKVIQ